MNQIRWKHRFENYEISFNNLEKFITLEVTTELERAGIIQLFEICFELSWKLLKDYLIFQGYKVKSPRDAFKTAFQIGIIDAGHVWLNALEDRNLTVNTYDEVLAEKVFLNIRDIYFTELEKLYHRFLREIETD